VQERIAAWRADTPGCAQRIHLNNAGASLMPRPVLQATIDHLNLEAELGGYEAGWAREAEISQGYEAIASLLRAHPRNIAVVASATAGFVQVLSSFDLVSGDAIVTSRCDYTSNQIQYLSLRQRLGVRILHAPDLPEGGIDPDGVRTLLRDNRCRLVAVSWIPTNSGLVQDVEAVGAVCESAGVPFLVDACQAVGQMPVDVTRLRCDYLSATARKFLRGPRGIGFLYASDRALARGDYPLFVDMHGATWVAPDRYEVSATAQRYEDWEFPYALVLGQSAAVRYALAVGPADAQALAWGLADLLRRRLETIPGVRVLDRGSRRCAIVTAAIDGWDGEAIARRLRDGGINTTSTLRWFGIYDMDEKGVSSAIRISPHYFNTVAEIDRAVEALAELASAPQAHQPDAAIAPSARTG
jgi:selenocysteine lyase/cysteine desulfurase